MAGIYLHIPFCKQACHYCDFHFSTNQEVKDAMMNALTRELHLQKDFLNQEEVSTVYFGGGTPSLLSGAEIDQLLQTIFRHYRVQREAEITLEANPDDLNKGKLKDLKNAGVNRLSIGIQSFQNDILKFLHRAHDSENALMTYSLAREAGFANISIDLIYAIPGKDDLRWQQDIEQAIELKPEHISCYSLTIEEKTVFGKWAIAGSLKPMDEDVAAQQLETVIEKLEHAGYEHYEISNFAMPGFYSRHNSSYWKQEKYLGIGPSAHSYDGAVRKFNVRNNHHYIKAINTGTIPAESETLSTGNLINEYILTTLRTRWGTDLSKLKHDYEYDLFQTNRGYIQGLLDEGLGTLRNNVLTLTRKGKLLADKIASDLFVV